MVKSTTFLSPAFLDKPSASDLKVIEWGFAGLCLPDFKWMESCLLGLLYIVVSPRVKSKLFYF